MLTQALTALPLSVFFFIVAGLTGAGAYFSRKVCWDYGLVAPFLKENHRWRLLAPVVGGVGALALLLSPWRVGGVENSLVFCFYFSLLAAMASIDLEAKLIPRGIWVVGGAAAIFLSASYPELLGEVGWRGGLMGSLLGAAVGAGLIYLMVEVGKLLFGNVVVDFKKPVCYKIAKTDEDWVFECNGERLSFFEMFFRKSDVLVIEHPPEVRNGAFLRVWEHSYDDGGGRKPIDEVVGMLIKVTIPREAMGFGDIKFMAMAGAMLGWQGALFSIFAGAVIGTVVGMVVKLFKGHPEIPFIPFLGAGMFIYMAGGEWAQAFFKF